MKENIAKRMTLHIYSSLPRFNLGTLAVSDKEARMIMEREIKSFGGIKIYGEQDEYSNAYDLFGTEDYAFYDGSIIRLSGTSYFPTLTSKGNVDEAINRIGGLKLAKIMIKCNLILPSEDES